MHNLQSEELEDFRSETPQAYFRYLDGILVIEMKPEQIIDIQTVERLERCRLEMTMNHELPVMVVIPGDHLLLDREAFEYFGSAQAMHGCSARAVVLKAPLRVLLKNFSLAFYRQKKPFRLFVSKGDAKMWLFDHLMAEVSV